MNDIRRFWPYLFLGYSTQQLHHPVFSTHAEVQKNLQDLIYAVRELGWSRLAADLSEFKSDLQAQYDSKPETFVQSGTLAGRERIPQEFMVRISELMGRVSKRAMDDADTHAVIIDSSIVSASLHALLAEPTDPYQESYIQETILSLETGSYRAAIVMGWNIAFDHLRQWIFASPRKRLRAFNTVLTARNRRPSQVVKYEDFFELRERDVIEDAYEARLFIKNQYQFLVNALTTRNHHAHPSKMAVSGAVAAGYIDGLIQNIIAHEQFRYRTKATRT